MTDDADRALDRALMARGAGETRPLGSAALGRVRAWLRQTAPGDWARVVGVHDAVLTDDITTVLSALDALDLAAARLENERAAERTRADAAEAERARLTTERDLTAAENAELYRERHELALVRHALEDERDAARAECARLRVRLARANATLEETERARYAAEDERDAARREAALATMERDTLGGLSDALRESDVRLRGEMAALRAIVEGRTVPPTPQEIDHHWRMGGAWLVARSVVTDRAEALRLASVGIAGIAWVALGGMLRGGTPCPWPTVAAEAATGAALAGEGR